jgi:predicted phage-related endonuclease
VVRARGDAGRGKLRCQVFRRVAALHVDDAALVGTGRTPRQQLFNRVGLFEDGITQIRPVETCNEAARLAQLEKALDVVAHARRRRRGERQHRNVGVTRTQRCDLAVLGAKVVPPFADAVRFVDRYAAQAPARQASEKPRHHGALRSDIQ